jgi:hypothetical protein
MLCWHLAKYNYYFKVNRNFPSIILNRKLINLYITVYVSLCIYSLNRYLMYYPEKYTKLL